ncbi:MAG: phosphoribosylformylglycinamidine synthase II, partial [Campylobacterales bacterium]|nr:phosphoribosylformylglycinamidine synthase II [Campylobacterales bacterium]
NVSLYNETNGVSVFPTPAIAMVGLNDDCNKVLMSSFQNEGNTIVMVGKTKGEFGGSLYIKELFGETTGKLGGIDYTAELRLWDLVINANKKGLLKSAKDLGMGGLAIALAKMSALSGLGVEVDVKLDNANEIFDETQSRAILEVAPENINDVAKMAIDLGLHIEAIGSIKGANFILNDVSMSVGELQSIYFDTFKKTIEQDL